MYSIDLKIVLAAASDCRYACIMSSVVDTNVTSSSEHLLTLNFTVVGRE